MANDQERGALALFGPDGCVRVDASRGRGNEWMRLNDLHQASGGDPAKAPAQWLRTESAQVLVKTHAAEMQDEGYRVVRGGNDPHTEAHWELAVAFTEWLSPAFHLRVIREWRAFNEMKGAAADGQIAAVLRALEAMAQTQEAMVRRLAILEAGGATISRQDCAAMRRRFLEVADLQVAARQAPTRKSGANSLRSRILGLLGWTGTGCSDQNMPASLWPHIRRMLDAAAREAQRAIGIQAEQRQQDLFTRH